MKINSFDERLPPPSGSLAHPNYRADIDGLRALAVLSVVAFHAFPGWVSGGFVGVDIFFVISGFLISTIIYTSLELGSFSFVDFYSRRIRRIFPALILVLYSCYVFGWFVLLSDEYMQLGKHIAAGAGFVSNFVLWNESGYFDTAAETKPLLHLWSLGIEEQFYIVWPLILWAAWQRRFNLLTISILVAGISFTLNLLDYRTDGVANFFSPQTRFWELLAGSLLAYITHPKLRSVKGATERLTVSAWPAFTGDVRMSGKSVRILQDAVGLLGALLVIVSLFAITKEKRFPGIWAILPVLGSVLVIAAGTHSWINRVVLSNRVLVWFGVISFPLYLWHWPLLSFARIIEGEAPGGLIRFGAVLCAVGLAWLTYKLLEHPLRFNQRARLTTLGLIGFMAPLALIGYVTLEHDGLKDRSVVQRNTFSPDPAMKYEANPASRCSIPNVSEHVVCEMYRSDRALATIVLLGDSTVGVWLPVFLDVAKKKNINVMRLEHPSCPPLLGVRKTHFRFPASRHYCDSETMQKVFDYVGAAKPELIFVLSAWNSYSPYSNREFVTNGSEPEADGSTTRRAIEEQVPITLRKLSAVGQVVVFKAWPFLPRNPVYHVDRMPFVKKREAIVSASYADFKRDSEFIESVFKKIDFRVEFFDPAAKICDTLQCSSVYNNVKLYHDTYHISTAGALQFRPEIEVLMRLAY